MYLSSIWYAIADLVSCFFFFQAEDGIRDVAVTGVQTCALPICKSAAAPACQVLPQICSRLFGRVCSPISGRCRMRCFGRRLTAGNWFFRGALVGLIFCWTFLRPAFARHSHDALPPSDLQAEPTFDQKLFGEMRWRCIGPNSF